MPSFENYAPGLDSPALGALSVVPSDTLPLAQRIRHIFTRPYTPKTNGKAERFIQTLLCEWAYLSRPA